MGSPLDLSGVYVPLITPFTADDKVSLDDLSKLARHYLDAGAAGLIALGTTGEPATLEAAEKAAVVETIGAICREQSKPFMVGVGTNSTKATLAGIKEAGIIPQLTAVLSVVPYYTRPSEEGIVEHFRALAESSPVPIVAYNIPYRTGRGLGADSLLRLAEIPNIAGLKQAVGGLDADTMILMANKPDDFHVFSGDDAFLYPLMCIGGAGAIAASSHVCTEGFVALVDAALAGDYDRARALSDVLLPLCQTLFSEPSPAVIKAVLAAQGLITTPRVRMPMTPASLAATERAVGIVAGAQSALGLNSAV